MCSSCWRQQADSYHILQGNCGLVKPPAIQQLSAACTRSLLHGCEFQRPLTWRKCALNGGTGCCSTNHPPRIIDGQRVFEPALVMQPAASAHFPSSFGAVRVCAPVQHGKNINVDAWRLHQLSKATANQKHAWSHFFTGALPAVLGLFKRAQTFVLLNI